MKKVTIFSTGTCLLCERAKALLKKWDIAYEERRVDRDGDALRDMLRVSNGARTVPQIVIGDKWIGGFTELTELHMDGELDALLGR